jgi:hypothetical protein
VRERDDTSDVKWHLTAVLACYVQFLLSTKVSYSLTTG